MLQVVGAPDLDTLITETVPDAIRMDHDLDLSAPMSEQEYLAHAYALSQKNQVHVSMIGQGYYPAATPSVIMRNIFENPGWYTAYTPYQAEIAQGRLEALFNFQTMVTDLTGMELSNASLLDEATAAAEAMAMMMAARPRAQAKAGANKLFVDQDMFAQTKDLLTTRAEPMGIELVFGDLATFEPDTSFYAVFAQFPAASGAVQDLRGWAERMKAAELQIGIAADLFALTLMEAPGFWGADVVVGSTQRFGIPMGFGGPHAGYFATHEAYKRHVPGRIIGQTIDMDEQPALRMALQTREQHIKRDRATSNICTSQVLLAVMAGMYAVYHGAEGLKQIATDIHGAANKLHATLSQLGLKADHGQFFDTLTYSLTDDQADAWVAAALKRGVNLGRVNGAVQCATFEGVTDATLQHVVDAAAEAWGCDTVALFAGDTTSWPEALTRRSTYMTHEVFQRYRSETEMMRYIKKLERRDISLNHSMIPLGSCTMKLNAASEMLPLSWPAFANMHPMVPQNQAQGYREMIAELEQDLATITGFAATSLQPNSGAQGEYAGLLVIRAYHQARGEGHRNIVLIPSSAHGTNPASAVMAGMKVVVVACDDRGNIDVEDLRAKAETHSSDLSALMLTYPSTHGVFETAVMEVTDIIHQHGGQVYMDGANMNAQVGLTSPGIIGADVCHLNLHKTFAIPHGGGGPGVGPICVAAHLAPFLPGHPSVTTGGDQAVGAVSAAPFGSALVTLISYGYIKMLGAEGLLKSTKLAILNANYLKSRLEPAYPVLYSGAQGRAAHEMILDCRPFKVDAKVEVTDIAKRLMDYGYHAPTVSFPVAGTLMVEPTESESKFELDRFCEAMLQIREEIDAIARGTEDAELNVLKQAPHTLQMVVSDDWSMPYSRQKAAYPVDGIIENKVWPAVRRVNDAYGDRNLVCACLPMEAYESAEA